MKQVSIYRKMKNDMFNWGQLLLIISNFLMICSFIFLVFVLLSLVLGSYPFILILSVSAETNHRFIPSKDDGTLAYGNVLHAISVLLGASGIAISVAMRFIKKKKDPRYCYMFGRVIILSGVIFDAVLLLVLILGILFFERTTDTLEKC